MKEKNKIILVGDIHGEFGSFRNKIKNNISDAYIIQVGDFGLGFHKPNFYKDKFTWLNEVLVNNNCHLYVIRGNHDDPSYFAETNSPESNITLLKDYSELELLNKKILLIGGAVSVDRIYRIEGSSWWQDEPLFLDRDFPYGKYDAVVTHTRPLVCGAFKGFDNIEYWCDGDPSLKDDLTEEGQLLNFVYEKTKPRYWFYGHFHQSLISHHENTEFKCLNIDESYMPFYV
jgi:UDP-2,3-diacylglucosamine pyrophosphatase LpxH